MSMKKSVAACVAGAASLAAAPAALAGPKPPDISFPTDRIEHRVEIHCEEVSGIYLSWGRNGCIETHSYITQERDLEISRDTRTGELIAERASVGGTLFSWISRGNSMRVFGGQGNKLLNIPFEAQAALTRGLVRRGDYAVAREEVRDGRAVLVLTETAAAKLGFPGWTKIVDKATYQTLAANYVSRDGLQKLDDRLVSVEQLPRTPENERLLQMSPHPDAEVREVIHADETIPAAARKAGVAKAARAQISRAVKAAKKKGRR